jgi:hypothetical protein
MAQWSASLDKPPVFEAPNAVAYVTYSSDDGRSEQARVPYDTEDALLNFLARECARRSAFDDRSNAAKAVVSNTALVAGAVVLPDISTQQAKQAAELANNEKIAVAIRKKQIADATVIDPTITADAEAVADVKG